MKKNLTALILLSLSCAYPFLTQGILWAEPAQDKNNQITAESPQQPASEQAGLTIDEIIKLKEAGISETTIQILIQEKQLSQNFKARAFAYKNMGTWIVQDSPEREVIIYSTGSGEKRNFYEEEYLRALEILRVMEPVIIPPELIRKGDPGGYK